MPSQTLQLLFFASGKCLHLNISSSITVTSDVKFLSRAGFCLLCSSSARSPTATEKKLVDRSPLTRRRAQDRSQNPADKTRTLDKL